MSTATSGTVSEVEVFRHQARTSHAIVRLNVDGVTQEQSLIQPRPAGNCLNWVVGHLLSTYEAILPMLGQERVLPEGAVKRYARGTPPLRDSAEAMEFGELVTAWDEAAARVDAGLARVTSEVLDRPAPFSPGKNADETIRSLLTLISFHQAYHAGQTGLLRRIAGKEGAVP